MTETPPADNRLQLTSPDHQIQVELQLNHVGIPLYEIRYRGTRVLEPSQLGIDLADASYHEGLTLASVSESRAVEDQYTMVQGKRRQLHYQAHEKTFSFANAEGQLLDIVFRVSDDGVAFRYQLPGESVDLKKVVHEFTSFALPAQSVGWLQPMQMAQTGWMNTNPAYEEHYELEIPVGTPAPTEAGWVFPALFKTGDTWLLISEVGVDGSFHASRLQDDAPNGEYRIGFPMEPEVFPGGPRMAESTLPIRSPWRTITIGSLATIIESTMGTDLADPAIEMDMSFVKPGIASWSWALLKDDSVVYEVQKEFIDYAADMGWAYTLIDVDWDRNIGHEKLKELVEYAAQRNVELLVWYNSSGPWNQTEYTPKSKLLTPEDRAREFAMLRELGVRGIKVDFFPGDGQSSMQYYNDILKESAQYGLLINYHGSSLPRGLQRTYPHMMTMESVHGFEMITFFQESADLEASHATVLPFARNAFDPMDFTPTVFHEIPNIERKTTNGFQLALPILFLSGIQHIAETPEGMATVPPFVKAFMSELPVFWDDTRFIDGYPGKLVVLARRAGDIWYVAGINGEDNAKSLELDMAFFAGKHGMMITDGDAPRSFARTPVTATDVMRVDLKGSGGFVMVLE